MTVGKYREPSIDALRDIVTEQQCARFRFPSNRRSILVDTFSASAIVACYDALTSPDLKAKVARMIAASPVQFHKVAGVCLNRVL